MKVGAIQVQQFQRLLVVSLRTVSKHSKLSHADLLEPGTQLGSATTVLRTSSCGLLSALSDEAEISEKRVKAEGMNEVDKMTSFLRATARSRTKISNYDLCVHNSTVYRTVPSKYRTHHRVVQIQQELTPLCLLTFQFAFNQSIPI